MAITSRQELAEFCLRQLGGGVINIEVSPEQLDDCIELAIEYYRDYHFDGCEKDFLPFEVSGTQITLPSAVGFTVGDGVRGVTSTSSAKILQVDLDTNVIMISRQVGGPRFAVGETVITGNGATTTITAISLGLVDKQYVETDESVMGVTKIMNMSNVLAAAMLTSPQYQFMASEIQNIMGGQTQYLYGVMNYMAQLDFILRKEKDYRFNRRMGKIFLDIDWTNDVTIGNYLVAEIYRYVDDDQYYRVLNDIWLKRYATALIKKQWGANTSKYGQMTLPGGLTYTGQQKFDEAVADIDKLEEEARNQSAPLNFLVG